MLGALACRLPQVGARLQFDDVIPINVDVAKDVGVIDLDGISDDSDDGGEAPQHGNDNSNKVHGFFVKNAMQRAIAPELIAMDSAYPGYLWYWKQHGIDIAIAADGIAVVLFHRLSIKLEIGAAKIILPFAAEKSVFKHRCRPSIQRRSIGMKSLRRSSSWTPLQVSLSSRLGADNDTADGREWGRKSFTGL
jgi:hypothetical protein